MILSFIKFKINKILRSLYWLYKLAQIKKGKGQINYPIKVEGKGECVLGNNFSLGRESNFGFGDKSRISFGDNFIMQNNVIFKVSPNQKISFGNDCSIGRFTEIYINNNWNFGDKVKIASNCAIFSREKGFKGSLTVGSGSSIGDYSIIDLCDDVIIGEEVALGPRTTIYTHDHLYGVKDVAAWKGGIQIKPVEIKKGAWIGANVTIMPGIVIGEYSVVATGAVVTKNVEPNTVYGGIPAKKIKEI